MKVNANICALPGLLPFISLTFRRSSGSCQAQFLSGRSCILLTAAERLHVSVCTGGRAQVLLASSYGKEGVSVLNQCLFGAVGYCPAAGGLYMGSSEAEMILLGTRVVFCHRNDPCQRGSAGECSSLAAQASQSVLNKPPRMGALPRGKPWVVHPSLLLEFGHSVLGEECCSLICAEEQTLLPACVWNKY